MMATDGGPEASTGPKNSTIVVAIIIPSILILVFLVLIIMSVALLVQEVRAYLM